MMSWALALHLKNSLAKDYLTLVAAGIGFYFLLATFPAIAAVISVYGLFSDPAEITTHIQLMQGVVPANVLTVISDQARTISAAPAKTLSTSLIFSIFLTVYGTSKGIKALIKGINMAYHQDQRRNFLSLNLVSFLLTFLMVIYFIVSLSLVAGLPALFQLIRLPEDVADSLLDIRWPVLWVLAIFGLEILYYFGPASRKRKFRWLSYGSLSASVFWLTGSLLFSMFVTNFYDFNEIYGSLGIGIALLCWFWLSALAILVGAEINSSLESYYNDKADSEPSLSQ